MKCCQFEFARYRNDDTANSGSDICNPHEFGISRSFQLKFVHYSR